MIHIIGILLWTDFFADKREFPFYIGPFNPFRPLMTVNEDQNQPECAREISRRKRILFRAWRRGFRELDLIIGPFAEKEIDGLSGLALDRFEQLLDIQDAELYAFLMGRSDLSPEWPADLLDRLRIFAQNLVPAPHAVLKPG